MALATSMPLLGDLTLKFSRHSLHERRFQLPTTSSYNFYQCFEQAKQDIVFYNSIFLNNATTNTAAATVQQRDCIEPTETIFRFTGTTRVETSEELEEDTDSVIQLAQEPRESPRSSANSSSSGSTTDNQGDTTAYANVIAGLRGISKERNEQCSKNSNGLDVSHDDDDEDSLSDAEELASYFSTSSEPSSPRRAGRSDYGPKLTRTTTLSHNRKRSIEYEDPVDTKRFCRPRLNFEKMQERRQWTGDETSTTKNTCIMNLFRPISEIDL